MRTVILLLLLALSASAQDSSPAATAAADSRQPFTFAAMMKLKRVGAPNPSPDGKWVVFDAVDVDLAANTRISRLWIVPASGGEARRLNPATDNHEERPRFAPDGKHLIWTSKATDPSQIWMAPFDPAKGLLAAAPHQVTGLSTGADGGVWTGDGKNILFVSNVYPDCKDDACNRQRDEELKQGKVSAKIFTRLLYRHWASYTEFKRSHLFVVSALSRAGARESIPARDLTPGDHDVPPFNLGGQDMYASSPDGQEVAYTSNTDKVEATSTNNDVFIIPLSGGSPKKISTSPGNDNTPLYSPDGKWIAWRSMARAGYEADRQTLVAYERAGGRLRDLTATLDRSAGSFTWALENAKPVLAFVAEQRGYAPLYVVGLEGAKPRQVGDAKLHLDDLVFAQDHLYATRMSVAQPNEIVRLTLSADPAISAVTHMNDALLSEISMQPLESFTFQGANNDEVEGFLVRPPGFDPKQKYPVKFLIHGGPQGAWGDSWSYRWNPQLFAATGNYAVIMINFHGSTGYGQAFTDAIQGEWGGKPYEDLMKGLDHALEKYPFLDGKRVAALGASYGGYMVNWILGQTDRFRCVVSHDGVFNTEAAYGTTEELWFVEWEFKGPPWEQRELYRKWSPHLHAEKFKTPTLVVHGQLDYRLDVSEGFQLFTTLQRLGVPSKMLYFPDEGHWVLKPQNSQLWYQTVNDWVDQWCKSSRE